MTLEEKREFIHDLCFNIMTDLKAHVVRVPEEWDGIELRQWIADTYKEQAGAERYLKGKRKREYRNAILVKNL